MLADRISATPADAHTGAYTYVHTQMWGRSSDRVGRVEEQQWRRADGAGRTVSRRLTDRPDLTKMPDGADRGEFAAAKAETLNYLAGEIPAIIAEPIPVDPKSLAYELERNAPPAMIGAISLIDGIASIPTVHYLDREHRAAMLRVLASVDGIVYRGEARDIAGRAGLSWSYHSPGSSEPYGMATDVFLFEPATGELLAHQRVFNTNPVQLWSSMLYLESDRRDRAGI